MAPDPDLDSFLQLSAILTGEKRLDRARAGSYLARLKAAYPGKLNDLLSAFNTIARDPYPVFEVKRRIVDDANLGPVAQEVIAVWCTSEFLAADGKTAIPGTQQEFYSGLLWKIINAYAPTNSPLTYGKWANPPAPARRVP